MGLEQEQLVRTMLERIAVDDRDGVVELYAADATYHVNSWREAVVGRAAIRAELDRQAGLYSNFRYELRNLVSTDRVVVTERLDTITMGGKDVTLHWCSVHEIDEAGLIASTREYYDTAELQAQLG